MKIKTLSPEPIEAKLFMYFKHENKFAKYFK